MEFDPKCVFSFRSDGESRKNEFSTQLEGLRQPGVFRCFVKPTQNGGMKPTSWNSIPGCFFVSLRRGKSKKRVFKANGRPSSTRLFALLARAQQICWYETDLVEFDPKGVFLFRPDGKTRQNEFSTQLEELRHPGVFRCLVKPTQNGGMKPTWWNSIPRVLFRFAPTGNVERTSFERNWMTFVNPAFSAAW